MRISIQTCASKHHFQLSLIPSLILLFQKYDKPNKLVFSIHIEILIWYITIFFGDKYEYDL